MAGKQEVTTLTEVAIVENGQFIEHRFNDGKIIRYPYSCSYNPSLWMAPLTDRRYHVCPDRVERIH